MPKLPVIHEITEVPGFRMEQLDLEFSNGARRQFRRVRPQGPGAVIIVAMMDAETVLLLREYAAGLHHYELGLPKGRIDPGEAPEQAANRELMEEAGFGARQLTVLKELSLAPAYMGHVATVVLAQDLYPQRLPGDEPEQMEVVLWPLERIDELMTRSDCTEGRSIAALYLARGWLNGDWRHT